MLGRKRNSPMNYDDMKKEDGELNVGEVGIKRERGNERYNRERDRERHHRRSIEERDNNNNLGGNIRNTNQFYQRVERRFDTRNLGRRNNFTSSPQRQRKMQQKFYEEFSDNIGERRYQRNMNKSEYVSNKQSRIYYEQKKTYRSRNTERHSKDDLYNNNIYHSSRSNSSKEDYSEKRRSHDNDIDDRKGRDPDERRKRRFDERKDKNNNMMNTQMKKKFNFLVVLPKNYFRFVEKEHNTIYKEVIIH
jgi:hypothetical protein